MIQNKWDRRFLRLAGHIAEWSKDPSTKCGAVIVRPDRTIASVGYNGFPRGMCDALALLSNREEKYSRMIHAEMNAILNASESLKGYTLYVHPLAPCDRCAVHVIQAGISRVVSYDMDADLKLRWGDAISNSKRYFKEGTGVTLDIIERNPEQCSHGTRLTKFCKECAQAHEDQYLTEHGEEVPYQHSQETL